MSSGLSVLLALALVLLAAPLAWAEQKVLVRPTRATFAHQPKVLLRVKSRTSHKKARARGRPISSRVQRKRGKTHQAGFSVRIFAPDRGSCPSVLAVLGSALSRDTLQAPGLQGQPKPGRTDARIKLGKGSRGRIRRRVRTGAFSFGGKTVVRSPNGLGELATMLDPAGHRRRLQDIAEMIQAQ